MLLAVVLLESASKPRAVFALPVVLVRAPGTDAVLEAPVVLLKSAASPMRCC